MSEIMADAVTPEGIRICKYAGMRETIETAHGSKIYKMTLLPPSLRVTTTKVKNLHLFYKKKYEEFRELL